MVAVFTERARCAPWTVAEVRRIVWDMHERSGIALIAHVSAERAIRCRERLSAP